VLRDRLQSVIPPSRAFILWRLFHNKIPTDENLGKRGSCIVSICHFCLKQSESSEHIFFRCCVTFSLWDWLKKGMNRQLDLSNCCNLILGTSRIGSKLAQQLMTFAIVHVLWIIWIERNKRYFHGIQANIGTLINRVMSEVRLSFDLVLARGISSMTDFHITHLIHVPLRPPRTVVTTDIFWIHPEMACIKITVDGSSYGSPSISTIGVVFRDWQAGFLGCFVQNLGHATSLETKFSALMFPIEKVVEQNLSVVWLESDSLMVVNAFNTNGDAGVPWRMRV